MGQLETLKRLLSRKVAVATPAVAVATPATAATATLAPPAVAFTAVCADTEVQQANGSGGSVPMETS